MTASFFLYLFCIIFFFLSLFSQLISLVLLCHFYYFFYSFFSSSHQYIITFILTVFLQTCGHHLCGCCWKGLISESVDSGPSCLYRLCPAVGCTLVIPEDFVQKFCPEKLTTYQNFQLETFVAQNTVKKLIFYTFTLQNTQRKVWIELNWIELNSFSWWF